MAESEHERVERPSLLDMLEHKNQMASRVNKNLFQLEPS